MPIHVAAIIAATLVSYVVGSLWYLMLGASWRRAVGWTEDGSPYRPAPFELGVALVGQLVMALALSGIIAHKGTVSIRTGLITGFAIWLGFILPTLATNVVFQRRNRTLIWQDGLHWLLVLLAQGAVLGAMG